MMLVMPFGQVSAEIEIEKSFIQKNETDDYGPFGWFNEECVYYSHPW